MHETELWITQVFNNHLAELGNYFRGLVGVQPDPRPWANYITMQILVAIIMVVTFALLRSRLSADRPGRLQHIFELIYGFIHSETDDQMGSAGMRYLAYFGTIFFFVLFANLIGVIPGFESPTMVPAVPLGCAMATFLYYHFVGIQAQGFFRYLAHFAGPIPLLAIIMVPIELVSHLARPLSLTIRLYANMFAGEQVILVFLSLTYFIVPALFMGLHIFVSLLQAYIFMLLTMMYVAGAVEHQH
ncbi:MAG TPA: F0F1 ATP synthase subunit A [Bryobacteraceae bacterium]|nr:F0F1 ATP synthase subunit A [Bryobacteraceae bacterium]